MMLLVALAIASFQTPPNAIALVRDSKAGEKLAYEVKSHLQVDMRSPGLTTWLPEELDVNYGFTTKVVQTKPDGIVDLRYLRPTVTLVEGETADSPPKTELKQLNLDYLLTLSPVNEVIAVKNQSKAAARGEDGDSVNLRWRNVVPRQGALQSYLQTYVGEVYRLALNTGSFDSALDFAPKLPLDAVKPGDTWKRTVSYEPQTLRGTAKSAVQRLDYTYAYQGIVPDDSGRKVYRITAALDLNTDLAGFFRQNDHADPTASSIRSIKLSLKQNIVFDLDLGTRQTIRATSLSTGGFSVVENDHPNEPMHEEKLSGKTVLRLVGRA